MNCPCCHKHKERKDFYWRGDWLAYKECRNCVKEIRDEKRLKNKQSSPIYFSIDNWIRLLIG